MVYAAISPVMYVVSQLRDGRQRQDRKPTFSAVTNCERTTSRKYRPKKALIRSWNTIGRRANALCFWFLTMFGPSD